MGRPILFDVWGYIALSEKVRGDRSSTSTLDPFSLAA